MAVKPIPEAQASKHATALIVSPSTHFQRALRAQFANRFQRVLDAASAEEALYVLIQHAVDLVVASTDLSGLDALALNAELRDRRGPPLVLAHRVDESRRRPEWIDAGVADCVLDSDPPEQIAARCARIVGRTPTRRHGTRLT